MHRATGSLTPDVHDLSDFAGAVADHVPVPSGHELMDGPDEPGGPGPGLSPHWGALPGWSAERTLLACYVTYAGHPEVHAVVDAYQNPLKDLPGLDLVARDWLHTTVQGVAFTDEVAPDLFGRLAGGLADRLHAVPPVRVATSPPVLGGEGVYLELVPAAGLTAVRELVRGVARDALPGRDLHVLPGQAAGYEPHLSIAYANRPVPARDVVSRLAGVEHAPLEFEITDLSVVLLRRDAQARRWHWTDARHLELGSH